MLHLDGHDVPGTEWLTPQGGAQPSLDSHSGPYSLQEGFETSPDTSHWACQSLKEALASIKGRVDSGYGCGAGVFTGANYTVDGKNLWVYDDDGEAYVHMVAS